ncbi:hypothetical protein B0H19DRAFT_943747, partial [Mycena capillaripes]
DPTVVQARERIAHTVEAEAEADRAVLHARARAQEALESVRCWKAKRRKGMANRAKAKNTLARLVSKDARGLERHG